MKEKTLKEIVLSKMGISLDGYVLLAVENLTGGQEELKKNITKSAPEEADAYLIRREDGPDALGSIDEGVSSYLKSSGGMMQPLDSAFVDSVHKIRCSETQRIVPVIYLKIKK